MAQHSGVGVLDKALDVLDAVAATPQSLTELVATTGLPRATAYRLAVALETHRLLSRDAGGRFVLGARVGELAAARPDALVVAAAGVLAWVRDECQESAQLYRRDGRERVCIATAERAHGLRTTVPVGSRLPLTAGSGAQVLCAWCDDEVLPQVLEHAKFSARSLAEVRRRGWAQSVAEREPGVASVSAPVRSGEGNVVAALSISGPIERLGRTPGPRYSPVLVAGAARISTALASA